MQKKYVFIALGIAIIIALVLWLVLRPKQEKFSKQSIDVGQISPVSALTETIFSPKYDSNKQAIYYFGDLGAMPKEYSIKNKEFKNLSKEEIPYVNKVKYSPGFKKIMVITNKEGLTRYHTFDIERGILLDLDANVSNAEWLDDNRIIYAQNDGEKSILKIALDDNSEQKEIATIDTPNPIIRVAPDGLRAVIFPEPEGDVQKNILYMLKIKSQELFSIPLPFSAIEASWAPDNKSFITEKIDKLGNPVSLARIDAENLESEIIPVKSDTDNIVWINGSKFLVAVSEENKSDQFFQIDMAGKKMSEIKFGFTNPDPNIGFYATNLSYVEPNHEIYFAFQDHLYRFKIEI